MSPGGSGYFTCIQNTKLVTNKFKSGGLHFEACRGNLESWEPSQDLLIDTGKPRHRETNYDKERKGATQFYVSTFRALCTNTSQHSTNQMHCIYLNINQLDALNFIMSLFHASTCFQHMCSSSGGQNCTIQSLVSSHL